MQKIHRRKNQDVPKDYVCTQGCGKAYGSHAALYTHMKNKHGCSKTIVHPKQIIERKTGKKGRPVTKQKELPIETFNISEHACKLCFEEECLCDSSMNYEQIQQNINILSDRNFLRLLHCIGSLNIDQNFTWIRSSQEEDVSFSRQQLNKLLVKVQPRVKIDYFWQQYLINLAKYIDRQHIYELYQFILLIITHSCQNQSELEKHQQIRFKNIKKCRDIKKKQWAEFMEFLKNV